MSAELLYITLYVVVEGPTEEGVIKEVLRPHLERFQVYPTAHSVGGGDTWGRWHNVLKHVIRQHPDRNARFTTMFDLYGLPKKDFPGYASCCALADTNERTERLEQAMADAINIGPRFIPYLQRHEFEALVLAGLTSPHIILNITHWEDGLKRLGQEIAGFPPEDINSSVENAPSKRLKRHVPGYRKTVHGLDVIQQTGIDRLRSVCPRFDGWLRKLESLSLPPAQQ